LRKEMPRDPTTTQRIPSVEENRVSCQMFVEMTCA
jgi:hypothetical protein